MRCDESRELLSYYTEGLVHGRRLTDLKAHIDACAQCSEELEKLNRVSFLLEDLDELEPPAGLWNGVYNRITDEPAVRRHARGGLRQLARRAAAKWVIGVSAAALAGLMAVARFHAPVAPTGLAEGEFVQGHVMFASQEAFADNSAIGSMAVLAEREHYRVADL